MSASKRQSAHEHPAHPAATALRTHPAQTRKPDPRRALGRRGEDLAAAHLLRLGFSPLERNVRTRYGEIDLIVFNGRALVFVEVKTRRAPRSPAGAPGDCQPLAGLSARQRSRLRRLAAAWLSDGDRARPRARTVRLDAIGVVVDAAGELLRLDHIEAAW